MSSLSMAASKMYFWRLSMDKMVQLLYLLGMASDHVLGCSWGHTLSIWMKFSENVGMIPIKICYFLQFLITWTNELQIHIQIVWKLCSHPVVCNFWWENRSEKSTFPYFCWLTTMKLSKIPFVENSRTKSHAIQQMAHEMMKLDENLMTR
mgnify:CR=1 FL=1